MAVPETSTGRSRWFVAAVLIPLIGIGATIYVARSGGSGDPATPSTAIHGDGVGSRTTACELFIPGTASQRLIRRLTARQD
jgi:hypothetical protein